jgi:hypothetical protein
MARHSNAARQHEQDRRQARQHFVHWGVKTATGLGVAALAGVLWLAWKLLAAT